MAPAALADTYKGYELPPFDVVDRIGKVEIRQYKPHVVAEVVVDGGRRTAASRGFRALAGYIFGGNDTGEKIAMTVPVSQIPQEDGRWAIRFMMPKDAVSAGLPGARNDAVQFEELAGGREAVFGFSGLAAPVTIARAEQRLKDALVQAGMQPAGPMRLYFYDDPMTLPWKRRTEVAVPVLD